MRVIETERLILKPLAIEDAPAIQTRFPHWEIVRWLDSAVPWPYPEDGAVTYLSKVALPAMAQGEAWHWTLRPKTEPGELIGLISLMAKENDNRGFWLSPDWQGRGLMAEASGAVTNYWFDELGQARLRVPKAADNLASRRVSERQGMRVIDRFTKTFVSGEHLCELWEITREEWVAHRNRG